MKKKLNDLKDKLLQKHWSDPVWSKVISWIIIVVITFIFGVLYKCIVDNKIMKYLMQSIEINITILLLLFLIIFIMFFFIVYSKIDKKRKQLVANNDNLNLDKEFPIIREKSTIFFYHRLSRAFPGQRGLEWYKAKVAVDRFKILFKEPLKFKSENLFEVMSDPIWWFRGGSALHIDSFKILSKTKILLGWDELEINKIAVHISNSYYKCFVYVETKGEKQTGLYNYTPEYIKKEIESSGYCIEEYGMLGNKPITRSQYDDGAAVINGKVVDASSAELRMRFLSDYNFIIAAKQSPYNSPQHREEMEYYLDGILKGTHTTDAFFHFLDTIE